jgi:hypothetical protein
MKAYGDKCINDAPQLHDTGDWKETYRRGLVDTEKSTAWAICYNVEGDIRYAQKTREFVMNCVNGGWGVASNMLSGCSHVINTFICYDITVNAGVYSGSDRSAYQSFVESRANSGLSWAEKDPGWKENMSHWTTGMSSMAALQTGNSDYISRAYAQFKRRIDATGSDGRFYDFDNRNSVGYNVFSMLPLCFGAQTAKHFGKDWWHYTNNGRGLKKCYDFLASPACVQPGDAWIPSIYGNGLTGSNSETTGDYGKTLAPKVLSDQRFMFELAQDNVPDPKYEAILNDASNGRNRRGDIYDYHTLYWMGTFLNIPDYTGIDERKNSGINAAFEIFVNPNPFKGIIAISCQLSAVSKQTVPIKIFGVNGKMVKKLLVPPGRDQQLKAGITWNATNYPPGIYVVTVSLNNKTLSKRMILSR